MPALVCLFLVIFFPFAKAHEVRPAFLEIKKGNQKSFKITWKSPMKGDGVLSIRPIFPAKCNHVTSIVRERVPGALIERQHLDCGDNGLLGETISIKNLSSTLTDVLVRIENRDGSVQSLILKPQRPFFKVEYHESWLSAANDFVKVGIEHILSGFDHLLFILGLLLIIKGKMMLFKTVTSFTIAHSLTLGLSTLNIVQVPIAPIEATIALSIFFLGPEIVRTWAGKKSLMINFPWIIAFLFGLLHGFGFATGLSLTGLPQMEIPFALLWFNLGVELGQLSFVVVALSLFKLVSILPFNLPIWIKRAPGYLVGSCGAFWFIQRTYELIS